MGVLHSIPLCSRGNPTIQVEPLDLDKNNNDAMVYTSQPQPLTASATSVPVQTPEATSTPRPQSPTSEQFSDDSLQWANFFCLNLSLKSNQSVNFKFFNQSYKNGLIKIAKICR